jgi:hypothetical protein
MVVGRAFLADHYLRHRKIDVPPLLPYDDAPQILRGACMIAVFQEGTKNIRQHVARAIKSRHQRHRK